MNEGLVGQPRPYRGADDLPAILQFAGECNALMDFCASAHPGDVMHFMSNTLRGRNIEQHLYLYEDVEGRLIALIELYPAISGGYTVMIHPYHRTENLENALIAWSEDVEWRMIREARSDAIWVGCEALDKDIKWQEALRRAGYQSLDDPFMCLTTRSLVGFVPDPILPEGFTIRRVEGEHEADALGEVHSSAFNSNWPPGEYLNVMRTVGFRMDHELVVVAPDGRFAAFLIYWIDPVSKSGLFEPVGCHSDFRRLGLTKALMYQGMHYMQEEGMTTAIVLHKRTNPAATALYRSVGFSLKYNITDYQKIM